HLERIFLQSHKTFYSPSFGADNYSTLSFHSMPAAPHMLLWLSFFSYNDKLLFALHNGWNRTSDTEISGDKVHQYKHFPEEYSHLPAHKLVFSYFLNTQAGNIAPVFLPLSVLQTTSALPYSGHIHHPLSAHH